MNHSTNFIYPDIGDTLVAELKSRLVMNVLGIEEEIFKRSFREHNRNMYKGIITPFDFIKRLKNHLHMSEEAAINKWDIALSSLSIIEPMHQLVKDLRIKYKIGLLSNIYKNHFELLYKAGKIPHISYDVIIKSCDIGFAKPEREIYEIAVRKAQVAPRELFLIDNKKENIEAAIKFGWQGFAFDPKNPVESVKQIRKILL